MAEANLPLTPFPSRFPVSLPRAKGKDVAAELLYVRALDILRASVGEEHPYFARLLRSQALSVMGQVGSHTCSNSYFLEKCFHRE